MNTQNNIPPAKKLTLKKQSIRVLTQTQTSPQQPTDPCTYPC
jgi:hypothetical protein